MCNICVFAGTTEGRELVEFLVGQPVQATVCVAVSPWVFAATIRRRKPVNASQGSASEARARRISVR